MSELEAFRGRQAVIAAAAANVVPSSPGPAATSEGQRVILLANIGGPRDIPRALAVNADGVGLFRTEFLFMGRESPPSEQEQVDVYRDVFAALGPERPVVIRLADIGGDKGIPYLHLPSEANPFLGLRAIRLAYECRDLLVTQVRAISTAAALAGVVPRVMAPMIACGDDVALLRSMVDEAQRGLMTAGLPRAERLSIGIMVEIPSAALLAADLAPLVDFFSIGTNDLTQYLFAADRTNPALATFQDALHPAGLAGGADGRGGSGSGRDPCSRVRGAGRRSGRCARPDRPWRR